ncbi:MAG: hypothetical protein VW955_03840 [Gammaproteobacteria bacterium]
MAAFTQLLCIFFLSSTEYEVLGVYSFYCAIGALIWQVCYFEGHQHAIAGTISTSQLREFYSLSFLLWLISSFLIIYISFSYSLLASIFICIYLLSVSWDWLIHLKTIDQRCSGLDLEYKKLTRNKGLLLDFILPLFVVLILSNKYISQELVLTAYLILLGLTFYLFFTQVKGYKRKLVFTDFWTGVAFKRVDTVLFRLFIGSFWGFQTLGFVQPVFSMGRVVVLLTPYWINLNLNKVIDSIDARKIHYGKAFIVLVASYFLYVLAALAAYVCYYNLITTPNEYEFIFFILVFFFLGGQNTKAFIRALSISDSSVNFNNFTLLVGLVIKLSASFYLSEGNYFSLIIIYTIVDLLLSFIILIYFSKIKKVKIEEPTEK